MHDYKPVLDVETLKARYGDPASASLVKVADHLTPAYRRLLNASPFFMLATVGPEGLDCSPRGERGGPFVIADDKTIIIPDRRGNNRIDTLSNIVRDPRIAFCFLIPGSGTTVRLNGTAIVTVDEGLLSTLSRDGKAPPSAIVVTVDEVYFQCARAVLRAELWNPEHFISKGDVPSAGDILAAQSEDQIDGESYDLDWAERAKTTMW